MWIGSLIPQARVYGNTNSTAVLNKQGMQIPMQDLTANEERNQSDEEANQEGEQDTPEIEIEKKEKIDYLCDRPSWGETLGSVIGFLGMAVSVYSDFVSFVLSLFGLVCFV